MVDLSASVSDASLEQKICHIFWDIGVEVGEKIHSGMLSFEKGQRQDNCKVLIQERLFAPFKEGKQPRRY